MAYTPNTYTADGSTTEFAITFPFLREADIVVSVFDASGNVISAFDFEIFLDGSFKARVVADGTITDNTPTALPANYTVTISRNTDISTLGTTFVDGVSLRAADINILLNQQNYALQEFGRNTQEALGKNVTDTAWDATSLRITNLAQPTADNDAMRKVDIDSGIGSDITTVAGIAAAVSSVAADTADIGVVASNLSGSNTIGTVAGSLANVDNVSGSIANVNAVAGNATNINAVAGNVTNINTVAADATNINTIVANLANINTVAADTADIGTVAADIQVGGPDNIGTVANAVGDVGIVAGINGQVQTVAGAIANVNTVAADTADIGTVATNIANVNTVAGISSDVTSLALQASNIGTLTQAANLTALQNAQANATAAQAALNQLNNKYHGSFTNVNNDDAEVLADIAGDANLTLEAGDLYFDSTNSKLRYYDGSNWYNAAAAQVINTTSLQNVGDVKAYSGLTTDDFLKYDGAGWQNVNPAAVRQAINVEDGATADQTGSEIATRLFNEPNTNNLTDTLLGDLQNALQPSDVVNDVTTGGTQVPLSAAQGVALKGLVDTNAAAITGKQDTITTSTALGAASLTTRVGTADVDVRRALVQTPTSSADFAGDARLYNVATTGLTLTMDDTALAEGDIITVYANGYDVTIAQDATNGFDTIKIDGTTTAHSGDVTVANGSIATISVISTTGGSSFAVIAGSNVT